MSFIITPHEMLSVCVCVSLKFYPSHHLLHIYMSFLTHHLMLHMCGPMLLYKDLATMEIKDQEIAVACVEVSRFYAGIKDSIL